MKIVLALVAFISAVALSSAVYSHTAGAPSCTENNVNTLFRNNWDPTRFWVCSSARSAANVGLCPDQTGFQNSKKACVSWSEWIWEEPYDPPTA